MKNLMAQSCRATLEPVLELQETRLLYSNKVLNQRLVGNKGQLHQADFLTLSQTLKFPATGMRF